MFIPLVFLLVAAVSVSARAISLTQPLNPRHLVPRTPSSSIQCSFSPPSYPLSPTISHTQVPVAAWPVISKLLYSSLLANSHGKSNEIQTLDLGADLHGQDLEGVMLSIVYAADIKSMTGNGHKSEIKRREPSPGAIGTQECLGWAAQDVENLMMMEGSMDIQDDGPSARIGKVTFLVYRVD